MVTCTAKAPLAWGKLLRRERKRGIKVVAVTQRPAEADKTCLSQAALIRTGALGREADRASMAKEMNVNATLLTDLIPLDWIEFHRSDLSVLKGNLEKKEIEIIR
ncbi:hypothetical protein [Candidatus Enterovibrio escicola]|uniref:hypothetical protein n=1 Tax=Candidatus Enterovibrio escicola TaxID=1927127 RepID=UPI000BE262FC|nr:hypothetical protein [Candidatus Enterovibrio escacola]